MSAPPSPREVELQAALDAANLIIIELRAELEEARSGCWIHSDVIEGPEFLAPAQVYRMQCIADFLLSLTGGMMIVNGRDEIQAWAVDSSLATDEDLEHLEDILSSREREANLRGEAFAWEEAA